MGSLNVIFQSQTILKSLFYTAENWPKPEEKKETLRTLIHMPLNLYLSQRKENQPHPKSTHD